MLIRRVFCISVLLAIFLFSMVPEADSAGTAEWSEDGVAVCTAEGNQEESQIVPAGAGGAIVVWIDKRTGGRHVYAQRLDASGNTMWKPNGVAVCTADGLRQGLFATPDGMGGAVVVWKQGPDYRSDIYAQRVDANGNMLWAGAGVAVCTAAESQFNPMMTSDGYGGAIFAWVDERSGNGKHDIYAQHIDSAGAASWAVDGIAVCPVSARRYNQAIVSDGSHGAIISWEDLRSDEGDIYAQRFDIDGNPLWDLGGVAICVSDRAQARPQMMEHDGGAIMVWEDAPPDSGYTRIFAQRLNASGEMQWGPGGKAISESDSYKGLCRIVPDASGGALLCWDDAVIDSDERRLLVQRVTGSGSKLWGENGIAVDVGTYDYDNFRIVGDGLGGAFIVWDYWDVARVFAQHVDKNGTPLWFFSMRVCGLESAQKNPGIVSNDSGGAIITWQDGRSNDSDIYAQSIDALKPEGSVWYLAEGSTAGGMDTWVLVQNPTESPVEIALDFQTDIGPVSGPRGIVPPLSRTSYYVGSYVTTYNVSTVVSAGSDFIVCERAMYGNNLAWAHDSIGVTEPASTWYLAEGSTAGGMQTWVLVQNPGDTAVDVALDFQTGGGLVPGPRESLPANSRRSYDVGRYVTTYDVSTKVTASGGVVCERAMYGNNWTWAHDSIGATAPDKAWVMAEGCTGGGMQTWVLVQNPGNVPADVELYFLTDAEVVAGPVESIPPGFRRSYNVGQYITSYNVSTAVFCNSGEVICERAMYGSGWTWGHDSIGSRYSKSIWFLPEGSTAGGMETYILVMNMSDKDTEMGMFFLTDQGIEDGPTEVIPPFSRRTYYAGNYVTSFQVSTVVVANSPSIICERSMYGNGGSWAHCSIGY